MQTITSTKLQRDFKDLLPIPDDGYEVIRRGEVIGYFFPADLAINVATGVAIEVKETTSFLGRCNRCGIVGSLRKAEEGCLFRYLCSRCERIVNETKGNSKAGSKKG